MNIHLKVGGILALTLLSLIMVQKSSTSYSPLQMLQLDKDQSIPYRKRVAIPGFDGDCWLHGMQRMRNNVSSHKRPPRLLFTVPSTRERVLEHVARHTKRWFHDLGELGTLLYVIGSDGNVSNDRQLQLALQHFPSIQILQVGVDDQSCPPFEKAMLAFAFMAEHVVLNHNFVILSDFNTYFQPRRVAALVKYRNPHEHLYLGRPMHECRHLSSSATINSAEIMDVHYCSGMLYILSKAALFAMQNRWKDCIDPRNNEMRAGQNSDFLVGLCLKRIGLQCTEAVYNKTDEPDGEGIKQTKFSVFCQDRDHQGGMADIGNISRIYKFSKRDFAHCAAFYPVKHMEHARYVRYGITNMIEAPLLSTLRRRCRLAIGVLSVPSKHIPRDVIRQTWGRIARALGSVRLYFVLGTPKVPLAPHEKLQLERETTLYDDILHLHVDDSYDNLGAKSVEWFAWAANNTECEYIFKTDDDSYVRVLPLLDFLSIAFGSSPFRNYFGIQWGGWEGGRQPTVDRDPSSAWYMYDQYAHDTFPPYMSGAGYGMSRDVALWLASHKSQHPHYRVEDAGIGIILNSLRQSDRLHYHSDKRFFDYENCTDDTVLDNPTFSHGFNMYVRYSDDMNGAFCAHVDRSTLNSPEKHFETSADAFSFKSHDASSDVDHTPPVSTFPSP